MTTIFLDESGYTGDDLLNPEQPFFVVASSVIGDAEAAELLRRCFPRYQGAEFKFSNIWKRAGHRDGLRTLAREIPMLQDQVYLWIIDKRFCLLTKMLDYLIEPMVYDAGRDFYAGGYAQRFMNSAHRDILRYGSDELYSSSVTAWDTFARAPAMATIEPLRALLDEVSGTASSPLRDLYRAARTGLDDFLASNERLEDFSDSSEIQLTSVFSSVIWWRQHRPEDFDLVHDESSNFLRQRDMWGTMLRDDFVSPPMPQGNGTLVEFPLRVRSTVSASSHASPAIQLCDVLAGLGAKFAPALQGRESDPFLLELIELGAGALTYSGVMPHDAYAEGPPPRRDGPDMVDRMVELLDPQLTSMLVKRTGFEAGRPD
ncbi:DUF3800 domain-containing protein [Novosphingobium sp. RL4]|uniref:DUF3800 domain-containing protein n=1 Tax=Novosphingobium sp. RL4 TaxID=3109595 RepID=UPI002D76CE16|nr:DUF3800 domain-containing protein [Novosphingobium sp. RL4]WRT94044.1 DUF3800 domain-containing protein [Novosphingobium sp. RL4]